VATVFPLAFLISALPVASNPVAVKPFPPVTVNDTTRLVFTDTVPLL
jgi:hypothetical protein